MIRDILEDRGITLTDTQADKFQRYYELLVEWNEKMNLTAITDEDGVAVKHFYDSLTILDTYDLRNESLIDVGAGAGFPSIPLKIMRPDLKVTIVDSLGKRITFLNHLVGELGLENVTCVHARAEEYAQDYRESFDIATARAVARLNILAELCLPYVRMGGHFLALKGRDGEQELREARKGINQLGGKVVKDSAFSLSDESDFRHNIVIEKVKNTPARYPRQYAKIKKKPL